MKVFIYILLFLSAALLVFNLFQIDTELPFRGTNQVAAISILASGCAMLLLIILLRARKIKEKKQR
ncbi:hypothetical protein [Croceiramulus getboli]|nr:hypothetical protein P8624_05880 [Flavobacteriaceae bacterium YJPT1-3]